MGLTVELRRKPHAQQIRFINADDPEQLYGGAKRGGKTISLGQKAILLSIHFPGNRGLLARKDFTDLQDTTLKEFFETCPPGLIASHNKTERCIRLINGSEILYRGLGSMEDIEKAKGLNLGWFAIDEPSEIELDTYLMLRAQLTWVLPDGRRPPYMALLGCNPEPGWVKDRFITNPVKGSIFIPALPRDNPYLPEGWEQELRDAGYSEEWIKKYLEGSWDVAEGQVFPELGEAHMLDDFPRELVRGLRLVRSIDHATTGITACSLAGMTVNDDLIVIEVYYQANRLISEHAEEIRYLTDRYVRPIPPETLPQPVEYTLIDPSTFAKTLQGGNQLQAVADLYRDHGINAIPAWNALEMGIAYLKERMRIDPQHYHPYYKNNDGTPVMGAPRLYLVRPKCRPLIKEMSELKKEVMESGRVRYVGPDHALDTVRYISNSRPRRPEMSANVRSFQSSMEKKAWDSHQAWLKKFDVQANGSTSWF